MNCHMKEDNVINSPVRHVIESSEVDQGFMTASCFVFLSENLSGLLPLLKFLSKELSKDF